MGEIKLKIASVVIGSSEGGGSGVEPYYTDLPDKPSINGETLSGEMTSEDLGLASAEQAVPSGGTTGQVLAKKSNADNDVQWVNQEGSGTDDYADLTNKPQINSVALSGNKSASDLGLATANQGSKADTAVQPSEMASAIGAVNPFAGEISATDAQRTQALANVSNQEAGYESEVFNGKMGYKVLQKNATFASQIASKTNTVFEIKDVFDLNGGSVTIPENCTLKFNGGKIKNGTVTFNKTYLDGDVSFEGCTFGANSTIKNSEVDIVQMGAKNDNTVSCHTLANNLLNDINGIRVVRFRKGTYKVDSTISMNTDHRTIVLDARCTLYKDTNKENSYPVVELRHQNCSIRGAGRNICSIISMDDSPYGVVRLGFRNPQDVGGVGRTIIDCSISGVRITGKANGGNIEGEKDVCLYMCNPWLKGSNAQASPSYFHRINDVSFTKANVGIWMIGDINGNQFSDLYFEQIDNNDALQGGAILADEITVSSEEYQPNYVRHPTENYFSGIFVHYSPASVTLRINGAFQFNIIHGLISEPSGDSYCIYLPDSNINVVNNTFELIDNNSSRNHIATSTGFFTKNNIIRYDSQHFFNLQSNNFYTPTLRSIRTVKYTRSYESLSGTSSTERKKYRFCSVDFSVDKGRSQIRLIKIRIGSNAYNSVSSSKLTWCEALFMIYKDADNTPDAQFRRLYQYGTGLYEPFAYTENGSSRLGFAFGVGYTGGNFATVNVDVEYIYGSSNDLTIAADTSELVVSTGLTEYKYIASITKSGVDANISIDNAAASVRVGDPYIAKLTANTGYTIGTVSVTMGSYDITDIVYNNGVVYIPNVTDDVVVTATTQS